MNDVAEAATNFAIGRKHPTEGSAEAREKEKRRARDAEDGEVDDSDSDSEYQPESDDEESEYDEKPAGSSRKRKAKVPKPKKLKSPAWDWTNLERRKQKVESLRTKYKGLLPKEETVLNLLELDPTVLRRKLFPRYDLIEPYMPKETIGGGGASGGGESLEGESKVVEMSGVGGASDGGERPEVSLNVAETSGEASDGVTRPEVSLNETSGGGGVSGGGERPEGSLNVAEMSAGASDGVERPEGGEGAARKKPAKNAKSGKVDNSGLSSRIHPDETGLGINLFHHANREGVVQMPYSQPNGKSRYLDLDTEKQGALFGEYLRRIPYGHGTDSRVTRTVHFHVASVVKSKLEEESP